MMNRYRSIAAVACIVGGSLLGGVGVTTANAAPVVSYSAAATAPADGIRAIGVAHAITYGVVNSPAGGAETQGVPIGPIVNWIKANASSIIPALKSALQSGIKAFTNWWNGLAGWIRTGISAIAQLSIQELFSELWNWFFG
jgi:hypothetical protein